ncbi:MAG: glycosyltransferase [Candidatus Dependentiae bacterium]|nr:glycosyltransferase [Candidatus Dependentiae bacterium]
MKKIVIFSSYGGGGHTAVANALTGYLSNEYEIVVTNVFSQVLGSLDPIKTFSFGKGSGEDVYNYFMPLKWYGFLNFYYSLGAIFFNLRRTKVKKLLKTYIQEQKPDIIISVIPIINNSILCVAQELNIPFLLIPTDLDITTFLEGIKSPAYEKFKIALAFEDEEARARLSQAKIEEKTTHITGFVVRPDFFEPKNRSLLKREFKLEEDKPTVLLLLGAVGLQSLYSFTQELGKLSFPVNLIICTGRQVEIKNKIDALRFPNHITKVTVGFTHRISDLMAMADILITKSGSVSVCESIYTELPMILDATTKILAWEQANHRFVQRHKLGTSVMKENNLATLVTQLLKNSAIFASYQNNLALLQKKHGGNQVKNLIKSML